MFTQKSMRISREKRNGADVDIVEVTSSSLVSSISFSGNDLRRLDTPGDPGGVFVGGVEIETLT